MCHIDSSTLSRIRGLRRFWKNGSLVNYDRNKSASMEKPYHHMTVLEEHLDKDKNRQLSIVNIESYRAELNFAKLLLYWVAEENKTQKEKGKGKPFSIWHFNSHKSVENTENFRLRCSSHLPSFLMSSCGLLSFPFMSLLDVFSTLRFNFS